MTLNRSGSGQGRLRTVEIWERGSAIGLDELEDEVGRRDRGEGGRSERFGREANKLLEAVTQADLPVIWGAGWRAETLGLR